MGAEFHEALSEEVEVAVQRLEECRGISGRQQSGQNWVMAAASPCSALARTVLPEEAFFPGGEVVVVEVVGRAQPGWRHQSKSAAGCSEETTQLALEDVRTASDEVCCGEEEFWWCGAQWWLWMRRRCLASPQMWCGASLWLKGFGICWLGRGGHRIDGLAGHWRGGPGRGHSDGGRH